MYKLLQEPQPTQTHFDTNNCQIKILHSSPHIPQLLRTVHGNSHFCQPDLLNHHASLQLQNMFSTNLEFHLKTL